MIRIAFVIFLLLCAACANAGTRISREDAIQHARDIASVNQPELEATNVPFTNVRAERMTFLEAVKRAWKTDAVPSGQDPQQTVWLVTMDGEWHNAFPMPTGTPPQQPLHHFTAIVDAMTGEMLGSSYTP